MRTKLVLYACFVALIVAFPLTASAQAIIEVDPLVYDFGNVQVGSASTAMISIGNGDGHPLEIYSVSLSGSSDFYISMEPDPIIEPGGLPTIVEITFAPSATGYVSATLDIESNDGANLVVSVSLAGMGVGQEEPPVSVGDILAFFDESVANGTLYGDGPGNSADGRRNALRNQIEAAGDLIDDGVLEDACQQLLDAYQRCDGLPRPPEFVAGPATSALAQMIFDLMAELGC